MISIMSYSEPCRTLNGGTPCQHVPQYGHDGDTAEVAVAGADGRNVTVTMPLGDARNDPGRVFRERRAEIANYRVRESLGVHCCTCSAYLVRGDYCRLWSLLSRSGQRM